MNVTISADTLAKHLRLVSKAVPHKPSIASLSHVWMRAEVEHDELSFAATDLEVAIKTECTANIHERGVITLPALTLLGIVDQLSGNVHLNVDKNHVKITSGSYSSKIQTAPAEFYPRLEDVDGEQRTFAEGVLQDMAKKVLYAIHETSQFVPAGALLSLMPGVAAMIATDGKRLSVTSTTLAENTTVEELILPIKALQMLSLLHGAVKISQTDKHLFFEAGTTTLLSRKLEAKYPNWERIVPKDNTVMSTVNRKELSATIKRVLMTATDHVITVEWSEQGLTIAAKSVVGDAVEQVITASMHPLKVSVNGEAVLDFLKAASGETVTLSGKDPKRPLRLDDTDFMNVIMAVSN